MSNDVNREHRSMPSGMAPDRRVQDNYNMSRSATQIINNNNNKSMRTNDAHAFAYDQHFQRRERAETSQCIRRQPCVVSQDRVDAVREDQRRRSLCTSRNHEAVEQENYDTIGQIVLQ